MLVRSIHVHMFTMHVQCYVCDRLAKRDHFLDFPVLSSKWSLFVNPGLYLYGVNPLPTIGNSLKKQKRLYKVLTPSIKPRI